MPRARLLRSFGTIAGIAALGLTPTVLPTTAFAASSDTLVNPGFESVTGTGAPEGWGVWAPRGDGTATVTDGAGPDGSRALSLTGNSTDDRIAVSQRITYPTPSQSRYLVISFDERATNVTMASSSWQAAVRVQFVGTTVPLVHVGSTSGTTGWQHVTDYVKIPVGTTELAIEPMLDSGSGMLQFDNFTTSYADDVARATATAQPTGQVDLGWSFSDLSQPARIFDVHRSTQADFVPDDANLVRSVPDSIVAGDFTAAPGTTYYYRIVARAADGTPLATTQPARATTPATPAYDDRTDVLIASTNSHDTHLTWRRKAGEASLDVYAGPAAVATGDLTDAHVVGTAASVTGELTVPAGDAAYALVDHGTVVATATAARLRHALLWITPAKLAKVREQISQPGDPREMWHQLLARVAQGPVATATAPNPYSSASGEGEGRYAAEAAFAYQVTGDRAYAEKAYEGVVAAEPKLPLTTLQPLDNAHAAPVLAEAYSWAYPAWTDAQRADANRILSRIASAAEVAHHPNMDDEDKSSNWVGVTRGGELALRLATRGDGWFGDGDAQDARIAFLSDQLHRHLDEAFSDTGWTQEGPDYVNYDLDISLPGLYAAQDAGITALDSSLARPQFANLLLHSLAVTPNLSRLQWGVGSATGRLPVEGTIARLVPTSQQPAWMWHFQHTVGTASALKVYAGNLSVWPLLDWPAHLPALNPETGPAALRQALMDDRGGDYLFRSGYQGARDVLAGLSNRNSSELGWDGLETFGLSLTSNGVTWAQQPGKHFTSTGLYSKPLIDGRPEDKPLDPGNCCPDSPGQGRTLASVAYGGQGGGYVSLDGSANYAVQTARRDASVDMQAGVGVSSVIAIHDLFADAASHTYDWQLSPETGTSITFTNEDDGVSTFTFEKNGAWLRGWILDAEGSTVDVANGALQIVRTGNGADFRVVLATGSGSAPEARVLSDSTIDVAGKTYDLLHLNQQP